MYRSGISFGKTCILEVCYNNKNNILLTTSVRRLLYSSSSTSIAQPPPSPSSPPPSSGRAHFKQIPVNPSILSHIEYIGVGIKPRQKRQRFKKDKGQTLNKHEERNLLGGKSKRSLLDSINKFKTSRRPPPPPPPFANRSSDKDQQQQHKKSVRHIPVKVLGTVGSLKDKMPRASKGLPEVAIAGRSNVGKSTLLNSLLYGKLPSTSLSDKNNNHHRRRRHRKSASVKLDKGIKAVTSDRPGETRHLTFYQLSAKISESERKMSLMLVDLPGYGFSFASPEAAKEWQNLMTRYILHRGKSLKRILLLIDARHGMKKADQDFLDSLQEKLYNDDNENESIATQKKTLPPIQIVLTKCDLVQQTDLARRVMLVRQELSDCLVREPSALPIMLVSAKTEEQGGLLELQKELAALVPKPPQGRTGKKGVGKPTKLRNVGGSTMSTRNYNKRPSSSIIKRKRTLRTSNTANSTPVGRKSVRRLRTRNFS